MARNLAHEMTDDELQSVSGGMYVVYYCHYIGGGWYHCDPIGVIY